MKIDRIAAGWGLFALVLIILIVVAAVIVVVILPALKAGPAEGPGANGPGQAAPTRFLSSTIPTDDPA
ncbi:MAG: hypothetical protein JW775_03445, partial [Candidatus Aminicenantes bacterium]|nr:hypothetical protein [Candidatus Aminicenantes bacterium]